MTWLNLEADKETSFSPIPSGVYNLIVESAEEKDTKSGDKRVAITFAVSEGDYAGRKIFEGYQLSGSPKSVEIGRGQLKSLWRCAGNTTFDIKSPSDLVGIEISASVKVKSQEGYDDRNVISSFKPKAATKASSEIPF